MKNYEAGFVLGTLALVVIIVIGFYGMISPETYPWTPVLLPLLIIGMAFGIQTSIWADEAGKESLDNAGFIIGISSIVFGGRIFNNKYIFNVVI